MLSYERRAGVVDDEEGDDDVLDGEEEVLAVGGEGVGVAVGVGEGDGVGEGFEDAGGEGEPAGGFCVYDCRAGERLARVTAKA